MTDSPASLPAVPANLKEAIDNLVRCQATVLRLDYRGKFGMLPYEKASEELSAARSHLENLFLEQQREIERLRPSVATETAELEKMLIDHERLCMEDLRAAFGAEDASRAIEPVTSRILASRKAILTTSRPTASPDQDFLKRLDDLISKAIFRGRDGSSTQGRLINGSYESRQKAVDAARQSLVDYVEGIRAKYDALFAEWEADHDFARRLRSLPDEGSPRNLHEEIQELLVAYLDYCNDIRNDGPADYEDVRQRTASIEAAFVALTEERDRLRAYNNSFQEETVETPIDETHTCAGTECGWYRTTVELRAALSSLKAEIERLRRFETYVCQVIAMGNQADLTVESLPR